jgi:ABC-type multidrug transport system fused ATPase/permease subunit
MDEATSALDNETEREVVAAIGRLRGERTIIIIAHRMTTVQDCNCLFLLDGGLLRDQGTYSELALRHDQLRLDRVARG